MQKTFATAALVATAALTFTACGDDAPTAPSGSSSSSLPSGVNDADVTFATEMIQHHAGALSMVDMTAGRNLDPEVQALAEDIRMAQTPEIETMSDWLQEWDQPVPETVRDHANAHGDHSDGDSGDDTGSGMPGMMSAEEMAELENTSDAEFEDAWLRAMIEHHQGAIEMANSEQADGENTDAIALAEKIAADQEAEIKKMEQMLDS